MKSIVEEVRFGPNDIIFNQGDHNDEDHSIYLIMKGTIEELVIIYGSD